MERKILTLPCEAWVGGDSFVQVMDVYIAGTRHDLNLEIFVMNLHTFELIGMEYEVIFFDSANNILNKEPQVIRSEGISVLSGSIGRASRYPLREFSAARKAQVRLLKGFYSDNNTLDLIYERMEKVIFNPLDEKEKEILLKALGEDAYVLAKKEVSSWRCICGFFNGYLSDNCSNCARSRDMVLQRYTDFTSILEVLEEKEGDTAPIKEVEPEVEKISEIPINEEKSHPFDFLSEEPWWVWTLLMLSGVLISASIFIHLTNG